MTGGAARAEMLARIRRAVSDKAPTTEVTRSYRTAGSFPAAGIQDEFIDRVQDYHATVICCSASQLPSVLAEQIAGRRVVAPTGLPPSWLAKLAVPAATDDPELSTHELDSLDGVVTSCALAIAQTGTVVLDAGPGQGRRALTLVPDNHWVIVESEQLLPSVPDAVAQLDPRRPLTWISGPSSTSDIELSRVEGVHGPRHLTVLLLTD